MATKWYKKATVQAALVAAAAVIIAGLVPLALQVPKLNDENRGLERTIGEKNAEIRRLETQLAPFKTIALERYTGPASEALAKLASQVELLQRLDAEKTAKIQTLEKSLKETSVQASPPVLSLASCKVSDKDAHKGSDIALQFIEKRSSWRNRVCGRSLGFFPSTACQDPRFLAILRAKFQCV